MVPRSTLCKNDDYIYKKNSVEELEPSRIESELRVKGQLVRGHLWVSFKEKLCFHPCWN